MDGDYDTCIANAQKCLALSEKNWVGDIPEYIVRSAMWLAMWLKGERDRIWDAVISALDKFVKASVVDFSMYLIDSHLAEVVFLALESTDQDNFSTIRRDEIKKYAKIAIKNLRKYVGIFAIGEPALNQYRGDFAWKYKKPEKAYQFWQTAAKIAQSIPISYELGRAE